MAGAMNHPFIGREALTRASLKAWQVGLLMILVCITLATRFYRLETPPKKIFDEVYFVTFAQNYVDGEHFIDAHPPLGKLLISLGIRTFGSRPLGWRVSGAAFGSALVVLLFALAYKLFGSYPLALLASSYLALDGLFLVQSRTGLIEIYHVFFNVLAFVFFLTAREQLQGRKRSLCLLLAGTSAGLGLSVKWSSAITIIILFGAYLYLEVLEGGKRREQDGNRGGYRPGFRGRPAGRDVRDRGRGEGRGGAAARSKAHDQGRHEGGSWRALGGVLGPTRRGVTYFGLVPALVYALSWTPHVLQFGYTPWDVVRLQWAMLSFHAKLQATHLYTSPWWSWPFLVRPISFYYLETGRFLTTTVRGVVALGNPILWWVGVPSVLSGVYRAVRFRQRRLIFVSLGFFGYYLYWALVPRSTFIYNYMDAMPFLFILTAYHTVWLAGRGRLRLLAFAFVAGVVAAFIYFYPVWTAIPGPRNLYFSRMWFDSWI
ncbi:MAG: phospholipid carrier-dependent glycosyltransferase [Firmicutes bacterium]|nr:phospholipid carrier-dependent glycosyltransferase [Bacillota bacterium]